MRRELPSGTITFLFTDIEGSTQLLDELGDDYAAALAKHRRSLRAAVARHGGAEVDTQGDAFFFAFPRATDALEAATEGRAALHAGPIRVRMGLHTGEPTVTEEGYVGVDVHKAARIASSGHGGQILLSQATRDLVDADVRDLGPHRLKDLSTPERIYQLGHGDFPRLKTLYRTNLPIPATPFLGRNRELTEVSALLGRSETRLLTLTGPGGTGKTRLAVQAAAGIAEAYPDGVWWVPLASVTDAELVIPEAERVLESQTSLSAHIGNGRTLLLFDNFEHVVGAASAVGDVLGASPNLDVLVTSREPLHLSGEREYPVAPLAHEDAVVLFTVRATAADPFFTSDDAVSEICHRVDELPLAVELAAARVKALPASEIVKRLERRLPFLTGGARDAPERQRTLRATIEWSYEMLTAEERRLFARLAVFGGGCTLTAAEQVSDADVDMLQSLVDKSLIRQTGGRYTMLETVREYATERLKRSHKDEDLYGRLGAYLVALVEREIPPVELPRLVLSLTHELENVRGTIAFALKVGDITLALRIANRGHLFGATPREQAGWLDQALLHGDDVDERTLVDASAARASTATGMSDFVSAERFWQRALDGYRRLGAGAEESGALRGLAVVAANAHDFDRSRTLNEQALAAAERARDRSQTYHALHSLAETELLRGDLDAAERLFARSARLAQQAGDRLLTNIVHGMGDLAVAQGNFDRAAAEYRRALRLATESALDWGVSACVAGLAVVAACTGKPKRAGELWGAVERLEREHERPLWPLLKQRYEGLLAANVDTASVAFAAAVERGRRLNVDQINAYALTE